MVVGGLFADRDHEAVEFKISGDRRKTASKASTLDMRTPDLRLLRELASKAPQENTFEDIGVHQCSLLFCHHLLRAQEWAISKCQRSSRQGRWLAWLSRIFFWS